MIYIIYMWIDFGIDFVIENILWNLIKFIYIYIYIVMYKRFKLFSEYLCGFLFGVGFCK